MVLFHRNANFFHVWLNRRQLDSHILQCVVIRCLETFYFLNLVIYFYFWLGCVFVAVQVFLQFPQAAATLQLQCRQPTPVGLPGKSHGWRSLVGYSPWGTESQTQLSDFTFSCCTTRTSVVAACGLRSFSSQALGSRLNTCGTRAQELHNMWDPPRPGKEPVSSWQVDSLPGNPWKHFQ